jgi:Uncharacterised protein family (UPF0231)
MPLRCLIQTQAPVPDSGALPVRYPACEWVGDDGSVDHLHPLNRFVCSWLISDMRDVSRCDEVLQIIAELQNATRQQWFVDGDAFQLDMHAEGVQFNQSNVAPEDAAYWNRPDARFTLPEVRALLRVWRDYLAASSCS